jgi:hypothetical protein
VLASIVVVKADTVAKKKFLTRIQFILFLKNSVNMESPIVSLVS